MQLGSLMWRRPTALQEQTASARCTKSKLAHRLPTTCGDPGAVGILAVPQGLPLYKRFLARTLSYASAAAPRCASLPSTWPSRRLTLSVLIMVVLSLLTRLQYRHRIRLEIKSAPYKQTVCMNMLWIGIASCMGRVMGVV